MSSILVIGGNGSLARHITRRFSSKGITVHSVIRNPNQVSDLKALGASPIVQSVEESTVSDFVQLIAKLKPEVVIWSAGAGGPSVSAARLKGVDTDGHIKIMDAVSQAAKSANTIRRFISISSIEVRDDVAKPLPAWYDESDREYSRWMAGLFVHTSMPDWPRTDPWLKETKSGGLNIRLQGLGGWAGTIGAGRCNIPGKVSRADVTIVLELCIDSPITTGLAFDVAEGNVPIREAVAKAEDSFAGYY